MHWPSRGRFQGSAAAAAPASGGAAASSGEGGPEKKKDADASEGKFDPEGLERGAAALKQIDNSKHSNWAFELAQLQEQTAQIENVMKVEEQRSARAQVEEQFASAQAEEMRRTISHMADQERNTAQYRAQVEHELQGRKLEFQREMLEYQLTREQEQFLQHEQLRIGNERELEEAARETIRMKAKFDRENVVAEARAAAEGAAQQERENVEVRLREMRARSAEERSTRLQAIEETFSGLAAGAKALHEDPSKMVTLVSGLTALALGVYSARAATRVTATLLERHLGRPPLVRETSRWTWRPQLARWPWANKERPNILENIVLEDTLSERLQWSTNALLNAQMNGTPFRHLMLHGPPGTGKTLFARTLARQSGLDYAIMSGGDLGPLGKDGPNELHKLFGWASRSKRGMVLFVDEADAFLRRGRASEVGMSEDARNALSVFLHHTGTENARVAVILATNVPSVLDRAVLDRIDEAFEFPRPAYDQRVTMLKMFLDRYINIPKKGTGKGIEIDEGIGTDFLEDVAKRTEGFSGRQLAKFVLALQSAVFGSGTTKLTKTLAQTVLEWRLAHPNA